MSIISLIFHVSKVEDGASYPGYVVCENTPMYSPGGRKPSLINIEPLKPLFLTAEYALTVHSLTVEGLRSNSFGSFNIDNLRPLTIKSGGVTIVTILV